MSETTLRAAEAESPQRSSPGRWGHHGHAARPWPCRAPGPAPASAHPASRGSHPLTTEKRTEDRPESGPRRLHSCKACARLSAQARSTSRTVHPDSAEGWCHGVGAIESQSNTMYQNSTRGRRPLTQENHYLIYIFSQITASVGCPDLVKVEGSLSLLMLSILIVITIIISS